MAGNPENAQVWSDADVYVAPVGSDIPEDVDTEFAAAWGLVGLLNGDSGFSESREWDSGDHFGWGGVLVRTTRRQFKLTRTFTALEDNETTRDLIWPGSTGGDLVVPRPEKRLIAFETREGDKVRRLISANYAEIVIAGEITDSEAALTEYAFEATIYPTGAGVLLTEQLTEQLSS